MFENALKQDTKFRKHKNAIDNNFFEQMNNLQHKKRLHDINILKQKKADEIRNKSLQISQEVILVNSRAVFKDLVKFYVIITIKYLYAST